MISGGFLELGKALIRDESTVCKLILGLSAELCLHSPNDTMNPWTVSLLLETLITIAREASKIQMQNKTRRIVAPIDG